MLQRDVAARLPACPVRLLTGRLEERSLGLRKSADASLVGRGDCTVNETADVFAANRKISLRTLKPQDVPGSPGGLEAFPPGWHEVGC